MKLTLKQKADSAASKFVIKRDGKCFTCGSKHNLQCGHFITRNVLSLRYDERNINAQCANCNQFKGGNIKEYERRLKHKYGDNIIDELNIKKRVHAYMRDAEYRDKIDYYKKKLKELENEDIYTA